MYSVHYTFQRSANPYPPKWAKLEDRKGGFPHSEIAGSKGASASPALIAACHVLHRLSTPRHPSEALQRLIVSQQNSCVVAPPDWKDAGGPRLIFVRQCLLLEQDLEAQGSRPRSSFTMSMPVAERRRAIPDAICEPWPGAPPHSKRGLRSNASRACGRPGGARRSRTDDILLAKQALYQLSYGPVPRRTVRSPGELSAILSKAEVRPPACQRSW